MTMFSKKCYFLRLLNQIDQNFVLIEDLQMKIPTNAYFCHQRAPKLSNCVLKNLKRPFLGSFGSGWPQFFFWKYGSGITMPQNKKEIKIHETLLLILEFTDF